MLIKQNDIIPTPKQRPLKHFPLGGLVDKFDCIYEDIKKCLVLNCIAINLWALYVQMHI
jgi:hypothetical protein